MNKKNLVFFMTDQQRVDTIGRTAGGNEVAPTWTWLKENGVAFENAYDSCPLCVPSRTSLATGMNPLHNGMLLNDLKGTYARDNKPLHEMLHEQGYEVAHVGVNHISLTPPLKDRIPYAKWIDDASYEAYAARKGLDIGRSDYQCDYVLENCEGEFKKRPYSNTQVAIWDAPLSDFKDIWFTDEAIEFINRKHERPFALFICLWAPHPPLTVPPGYLEMFPLEAFVLPENTGRPNPDEPRSYRTGAPRQLAGHPPKQGWQEAWSAHCALTRLCDDQLERIVDTLKDNGLFDSTMLVCTTDHGEQLGQHDMYQKMEMYESSVRVPAIFRIPGIAGRTYLTPVSHLDFVPTILDYLLGSGDDPRFDGISLIPSIEKDREPPSRDIFSLYNGNHQYGDVRRMIVRYPYKLIYDGEDIELFNLAEDPLEMRNLAGEQEMKETKDSMFEALRQWAIKYGDGFASYRM